MKTVLVPVDFSATSANTLAYVAAFCKDAPVSRIVLLKSCYVSVYAQILPSADYLQVSEEEVRLQRRQYEVQLNQLGGDLQQQLGSDIKVEVVMSKLPLLRAMHNTIEQIEPDLIIAGSDGGIHADDCFVSDQLINLARTSTVSVLIIPPHYQYEKVKRVVLACDYKTVLKTDKLSALEKRYNWLHPELLVLNVNATKNPQPDAEECAQVEEHLQQILNNYQYKVHYINDRDILHGITSFANSQAVQMIIALPGRHSFLYSLTHESITAGLSANSHQPVLILK